MLRSHIEWQQKTLLFVIYTSGFQQPCQRSLLPHGTTLISLSPIANGIIIDISYQCFCQIYVRFPSSCNHFVITNKTVIREVSLHGCTCSLKLSWYLWQQIPWCISDSYSHKQTGSEWSLLTLHDTDLEQFGTNWWYQWSQLPREIYWYHSSVLPLVTMLRSTVSVFEEAVMYVRTQPE